MKKVFWFSCVLIALTTMGCKKELLIYEDGFLVPLTADADPSVPSIQVNGSVLHAETYGNPDSSILLVLHGGPGSDYRYLLNCKAFADSGYFVVFYDQRGSGLSQRFPKESYSMDVMIDELTGVINYYRQSPEQKIFVLGHSWGAMLATAYTNEYPDMFSGVILGEPGGFTFEDMFEYVGRTRSLGLSSEVMSDVLYPDQFITGNVDEHAILDYRYALLSVADDGEDSPIGNEGLLPFWRSGAVINIALFEYGDKYGFDWTTNLSSYPNKILFVYSERNTAYGQAYAEHVSAPYNEVQLVQINNAGHDMISFPAGWNTFFPLAINYLNTLN